MTTTGDVPTHLDLIAAVRSTQRVAATRDAAALHDEVCRLRNALVEHIHDERRGPSPAGDVHERLVRRGHDELLRFIDDLLSTTTDHDEECACLVRAAELQGLLLRQIQLETRHGRTP